MPNSVLILCLTAGFFFGAWPIVMRASGLNWVIAATILHLASLAVFLPSLKEQLNLAMWISFGTVIAVVAGAMNGFGHIAFQKIIEMKDSQIAQAVIVLVTFQIATTAIFAHLFYGEQFGLKKIFGCLLAVVAVKLLVGK